MQKDQKPIVGAIVLAGALIAGAIMLRGSVPASTLQSGGIPATTLAPLSKDDWTLGNPKAKVAIIMYEDFQCPFCGAISGLEDNTEAIKYLRQIDPNWKPFMPEVKKYIDSGELLFVYRDWAFLGPESVQAAEAARCAGDQGKFWEYHDYLYGHQRGENKGNFSDDKLKSFAEGLGLDTQIFNECLDGNKYAQAVLDSKSEGDRAGITGTPRGFILKNGKIVATIDGAESLSTVQPKIENALQ